MAKSVQDLIDILALEPLEHNLFRGRSPDTGFRRVFGGLVIAQALMAACRTVDERKPHSFHAYFLLPGDPSIPIVYNVDRIRDGRSFTTRRVVAIQRGQAIFSLAASFQIDESGFEHQIAMPDAPPPESLTSDNPVWAEKFARLPEGMRNYFQRERPIEWRPVDIERYLVPSEPRPPRYSAWLRSAGPMPDDPIIHQCALGYASDMGLLDTSLVAHGRSLFEAAIQGASLDHALWFHRPFRIDDWLLYVQDSPFSGGARGFARGSVFTRDGVLVASVAQEGLIRLKRGQS